MLRTDSLESINIPESASIESDTFYGCTSLKTQKQPRPDVATLRHILDTAIYPPFFWPNPKFGNEYKLYFINYDNVMSDQLTIDGSNDTETALKSKFTLKGEPVVTYRSVEELVADGWQLD